MARLPLGLALLLACMHLAPAQAPAAAQAPSAKEHVSAKTAAEAAQASAPAPQQSTATLAAKSAQMRTYQFNRSASQILDSQARTEALLAQLVELRKQNPQLSPELNPRIERLQLLLQHLRELTARAHALRPESKFPPGTAAAVSRAPTDAMVQSMTALSSDAQATQAEAEQIAMQASTKASASESSSGSGTSPKSGTSASGSSSSTGSSTSPSTSGTGSSSGTSSSSSPSTSASGSSSSSSSSAAPPPSAPPPPVQSAPEPAPQPEPKHEAKRKPERAPEPTPSQNVGSSAQSAAQQSQESAPPPATSAEDPETAWFARLRSGILQYSVPTDMKWKVASTVTVVVNGARAAAPAPLPDQTQQASIKVSRQMRVLVSSPGNPDEFIIAPEAGTQEVQYVPEDGITTWNYSVTPRYTGLKQHIRIQAFVVYAADTQRQLPVYDAFVTVHVPGLGEGLKRLLEGDPDYWLKYGLPGGAGFIFISGAVAGLRKLLKKKQPAPPPPVNTAP